MALSTGGGILHLGGRERISRYDWGFCSRANALGYDPLPLREELRVLLSGLGLSA